MSATLHVRLAACLYEAGLKPVAGFYGSVLSTPPIQMNMEIDSRHNKTFSGVKALQTK